MTLENRFRELLADAFERRKEQGWTLVDLGKAVKRADRRVDLDAPALSRKLRGLTGLSVDELRAFAIALEVKLDWEAA